MAGRRGKLTRPEHTVRPWPARDSARPRRTACNFIRCPRTRIRGHLLRETPTLPRRVSSAVPLTALTLATMTLEPRWTPHHYEVLGRLMTALFNNGAPGIMEGAKNFRFWETSTGGFSLDWERGPHAMEVVNELLQLAADVERARVFRPGDVVLVHNGDADPSTYTTVHIQNVRVFLRPTDTIGHQAAIAEAIASLTP